MALMWIKYGRKVAGVNKVSETVKFAADEVHPYKVFFERGYPYLRMYKITPLMF